MKVFELIIIYRNEDDNRQSVNSVGHYLKEESAKRDLQEKMTRRFEHLEANGLEPQFINDQFMNEFQYLNADDELFTVRYEIHEHNIIQD